MSTIPLQDLSSRVAHSSATSHGNRTADEILAMPESPGLYGTFARNINENPIKHGTFVKCFKRWVAESGSLRISLRRFCLFSTNTLLTCLLWFHIRWNTRPLESRWFNLETYVLSTVMVGIFLWAINFVTMINEVKYLCSPDVSPDLPNLEVLSTKRSMKTHTKRCMKSILIVLASIVLGWPFVAFPLAPYIAWYNQMKDSCKELDTRVVLSNTIFDLTTTDSNKPDTPAQKIFLATRFAPENNKFEPFQYFERLSGGSAETSYFAVDVDAYNMKWRLLHTNASDTANEWLAREQDQYTDNKSHAFPQVPEVPPLYMEVIKNGTMVEYSARGNQNVARHLYLPELNFYIANMYDFLREYRFLPFLRVYRTFRRTVDEMYEVAELPWTDKNDNTIMMRSASFGYKQSNKVTMCIREGQFDRYELNDMQQTVSEDMLILFGIITGFQHRIGFACEGWSCRTKGNIIGPSDMVISSTLES